MSAIVSKKISFTKEESGSKPKLEALTSLRFFAAALVIIAHISDLYPKVSAEIGKFYVQQGLSFFFTLSGFILYYIYPRLDDKQSVLRFFKARYARNYPTHLVGILLLCCLVPAHLTESNFWQKLFAQVMLIQDWFPLRDFYWSLNASTWTLSLELAFYFCFVYLVQNFQQTYKIKLLGCFTLVLICLVLDTLTGQLVSVANDPGIRAWLIVMSPPMRLLEFCLGMTTALFFEKFREKHDDISAPRATLFEALAILVAFLLEAGMPIFKYLAFIPLIGGSVLAYVTNVGIPLIYAVLVYTFARSQGWISRALCWPLFVLLGDMSATIYMLHYPITSFAKAHLKEWSAIPDWAIVFGIVIAIFGVSYLNYEIVEKPMRNWINRWKLGREKRV